MQPLSLGIRWERHGHSLVNTEGLSKVHTPIGGAPYRPIGRGERVDRTSESIPASHLDSLRHGVTQ